MTTCTVYDIFDHCTTKLNVSAVHTNVLSSVSAINKPCLIELMVPENGMSLAYFSRGSQALTNNYSELSFR